MTLSRRYTTVKAWVSMALVAAFFLEVCAPVGIAVAQQAPTPGASGTSGAPGGATAPSGPATIPVPAGRPTTQPQFTRPQAPRAPASAAEATHFPCPPGYMPVPPDQNGGDTDFAARERTDRGTGVSGH